MDTQKVFRAGNSNVVAIPNHILQEVGFKRGQEVILAPREDGILIQKITRNRKSKKTSPVSTEFKKWLKKALEEDGEILDELALR